MRNSLIIIILLIFSSCEKIDSPIIGKWQYIIDIGYLQSETERILTFKSNGTASFGIGDDITHYTFEIDGDDLMMEIVDGKTLYYTWNIDNEGKLNLISSGGTMKFQRY